MADDPNRPAWMAQFLHRRAGAGRRDHRAVADLCRILLGMPRFNRLACIYTLVIAFLLVSTLPVFSGKKLGNRVPPEISCCRIFVAIVLFVALLVSYPWPGSDHRHACLSCLAAVRLAVGA